jgi:thiosulfate/3-mercaptopyruvate sulfurtransferase
MRLVTRLIVLSLAAGVALFAATPRPGATRAAARTAQASEGFEHALIQPEQLVKELKEPKSERPIVIHVGFEVLYRGAHIPGAVFAGPASKPQGLEKLRQVASRIPHNHFVVIYCGCCPMTRCPNIHPAYDALRKMGFRRLQVLNLPTDFAHDWVEKGLPTVKGANPR